MTFTRAIVIVLDSVGIGELPLPTATKVATPSATLRNRFRFVFRRFAPSV